MRIALLMAVLVAATACGGGDSSSATFVRLALDSSQGKAWGLSELFPAKPRSVPCVIHGGGPAPGIRVPGTCSTSVIRGDAHSATVRFTESWNASDFHYAGSHGGRQSHVWELMVSTNGANHVAQSKQYGDFPPQLVV